MQRCKEASGNGPDQSPKERYTNRTAVLFSFPKCEYCVSCLWCSFSFMTALNFALVLSNIYHPEDRHTLNIPYRKTTSLFSFLMYHLLNSLLSHQIMDQMKLKTTGYFSLHSQVLISYAPCEQSDFRKGWKHDPYVLNVFSVIMHLCSPEKKSCH